MRKTTESTDVGRPGSGLANGAKAVTMTLWSWQNSTSCLLFKYGCTSICKSKSSREKYYSHTWRNMNMYKLIHDVSWLYHHLKFMYTYTSICVQYCTCVRPSSRGECRYAFNTTANFAWLTAALILLQILPDWQLVWSCCNSYLIDSWLHLAANLAWLTAGLILLQILPDWQLAWSCCKSYLIDSWLDLADVEDGLKLFDVEVWHTDRFHQTPPHQLLHFPPRVQVCDVRALVFK